MSFDNLGDAATWFSAGVAVVSAIFTVWWPWHNRPQACFVSMPFDSFDAFAAALPEFRGLDMLYTRGEPDYAVKLTNAGDCVAFDVSLSAIDCDVFIVEPVEGVVDARGFRKILLPESLRVFRVVNRYWSLLISIRTSNVAGFAFDGWCGRCVAINMFRS